MATVTLNRPFAFSTAGLWHGTLPAMPDTEFRLVSEANGYPFFAWNYDTALFSGNRGAYTVIRSTNGITVTDSSGADGTDLLKNIERLAFADRTVEFDAASVAAQGFRLYQAAFNRAPDAAGLGFWVTQLDHGMSLGQVAASFVASAEFAALYRPDLGNAGTVDAFYHNVLHRAPEAEGLAYWVGVLDRGVPLSDVLAAISESAEHQAGTAGVIGAGFDYIPYT